MTNRQDEIPEAVASVTYTIKTSTGFEGLFTVRDIDGLSLLSKMPSIEAKFAEIGIVPGKRSGGFPKKELEIVAGKRCPKCGSPVVENTKNDGTKYHRCSTNKWNPVTKIASGCDWVDWDAGKTPLPNIPPLDDSDRRGA